MYDVACVGILCADVLAKPVNMLPEKGKLKLIDQLQLQIGGCASNTAIDLAKIGVKTAIIGKVGNDGFGRFIEEGMKAEGIDVSGLKTDCDIQTSASVVTIGDDGERSILHCLGTNSRFTFDDINPDIVKNSKVVFIAGTFLMPGFDGEGTERLLRMSKEVGIICCMDTAWDSTGQWMGKIEGCLKYLDWFMPSFEEARELAQKDNVEDIVEVFIKKGVRNVVIKLGKDGCYVRPADGNSFFVPAYEDVTVVDTSGAGDSFCAGFITGLEKGWDVKECAKFANAVGSHCVVEIGTTAGIKPLEEILKFMSERE